MTQRPPVVDLVHGLRRDGPGLRGDPFSIWDELRGSCPVAPHRSPGGAWLLTTYADVTAAAHDIERFSSLEWGSSPPKSRSPTTACSPYGPAAHIGRPTLHTWTRRLLLPWFSHTRVASYEAMTRDLCRRLIDGFLARGQVDGAAEYAQQIPVRVIAAIWVCPRSCPTCSPAGADVLEFADEPGPGEARGDGILGFLIEQLQRRRDDPHDDLISQLAHTRHGRAGRGQPGVGIAVWC